MTEAERDDHFAACRFDALRRGGIDVRMLLTAIAFEVVSAGHGTFVETWTAFRQVRDGLLTEELLALESVSVRRRQHHKSGARHHEHRHPFEHRRSSGLPIEQ